MTTAATEPTIHTRALDIAAAFHIDGYRTERYVEVANPGRVYYRIYDNADTLVGTVVIVARR